MFADIAPARYMLRAMPDAEKTFEEKMVENLKALLAGRALPNQDIESSNLNGQEITKTRRETILKELQFWECRVAAAKAKAAGGDPSIRVCV